MARAIWALPSSASSIASPACSNEFMSAILLLMRKDVSELLCNAT
jgi:hypothetical protein